MPGAYAHITLANVLNPPALARACNTVIPGSKGNAPARRTSPTINIRWLLIAVTITVTFGSFTYFRSFSATVAANCPGVSPAA